jgi:hypothetical protein
VIFVWLHRQLPSVLEAAMIFKPETLVRWHRGGFRFFWRWKPRRRPGRPAIPTGIRMLVRQMSRENPLWGAPRIHGELLRLGIEIAQSTVAKYMGRRGGPRSQGWKTFLCKHAPQITAIDSSRYRRSGSSYCMGLSFFIWDAGGLHGPMPPRIRRPSGSPGR